MKMKKPIRLGIVGVGKIVRDQHLPAVAGNTDFELVAAASRNASVDGIANFKTIEEMLAGLPDLDAVSLCMPPAARYEAAHTAITASKHVFLEKPPGATISEVEDLKALADAKGVSLFASWHSRYAPAVEAARKFLAGTTVRSASFVWKEDVRRWHPGQAWIWEAGGFGVFDPFINCLSIVTHILPPLHITTAKLDFPGEQGCARGGADEFRRSQRTHGDSGDRLAPNRPAELGHCRRNRCRAYGAVPRRREAGDRRQAGGGRTRARVSRALCAIRRIGSR
jgi:D-galactose 1-dehydrogenase